MATNKYRRLDYDGYLYCSIHKLLPINPYTFATLPEWKRGVILRRWNGEPKKYIAVNFFKCMPFDINTPEKLATQIRLLAGFGHFMFGINADHDNKRYSNTFICLKSSCPFFSKCKIFNRHKQGWSCKMNPKKRRQFLQYCEIEIMPKKREIILDDSSVGDSYMDYGDYYGNNESDFYYNIIPDNRLGLLRWFRIRD